jgi:hypothetical protein
MELSANALTTVERVIKSLDMYPFLNSEIDFEDADVRDAIVRLINFWSDYVCQITNNEFGAKTYTEFYKGTNQPTLVLKHYPILALTSLEEVDVYGNVIKSFDITRIQALMSDDDYVRGMLYVEPYLSGRYSSTGLIPDRFVSLRKYKIVYDAGYILPKDETELIKSTLPSSLEGLVIDLATKEFVRRTDSLRADGLIQLTEGNVQRMWEVPKDISLTDAHKQIISYFKRKGI